MKIGLTYDLRDDYLAKGYSLEETAELDKIETIEAIEQALQYLGYETERVGGLDALLKDIMAGKRWDLVFNISEGMKGLGRESAIPCILEAFGIPYTFSDPVTLAVCIHKGFAKSVGKQLGLSTADFAVVTNMDDVAKIDLPLPLFVKPVAEGTGKGISEKSIITKQDELLFHCENILKQFNQPLIVERYLPGKEFTVGIVGTGKDAKVLGILELVFLKNAAGNIHSYDNKANYAERVDYQLFTEPGLKEEIEDLCLAAWRGLSCRDAGRMDIRLDEFGRPAFIEVNPLAGVHPVDSDLIILCNRLKLEYHELIRMIIDSAIKRFV